MGMHQVRNARHEPLFKKTGSEVLPIEWGQQETAAKGGADPVVDEQLHAPKKTWPYTTYPNTPAPKSNEAGVGREGPSGGGHSGDTE
jgi:hypothetical protein